MSKAKFRLAALVILFLLLPAATHAQSGHSIRGKVRNSSGVSMPRVLVELQTGNGTPIGQTVTNNEGDFFFGNLLESSYTVIINTPDHNPTSESVQFVRSIDENTPGESRTVEITLTPRPGARIQPGQVTFAQNVPPLARQAFERGLKLTRAGKSQEGIAAMREATQMFPDYFDAHFALGSELAKAGDLGGAIIEFEHARRVNPKEGMVYYAFGLVLSQQKKHAVAAAVFAEAARLSPNDVRHPFQRATSLINHAAMIDPAASKKAADEREFALAEAEKALKHAYELSGKKMAAYHEQMARVFERRGDKARAADELEQYLRMNPGDPRAGSFREAIKTLRGASNK
ncbi:MAG TPA: tetratricopeptide repeat protein [Pyrinomonadaceae bacterium]|nr:tetratricopeptide repeat protein [Pyrinomonadaceae bacterium]